MKHYGLSIAEGSEVTNLTVAQGTSFPASPNAGELFYRTDVTTLYVYNGTSWIDTQNLVGDTTPQLGGDLDVNGNDIISSSNGNVTISPDGTGIVEINSDLNVTDNSVLKLFESSSNGSNFISFQTSASLTENTTYVLPDVDGSSGQFLRTNGTGTLSWATASGGGGSLEDWSIKTADYTAVAGDRILVDVTPVGGSPLTAGGEIDITLPSSPSVNDEVTIKVAGDVETYNVNVLRNGNKINADTNDLHINVNYVEITFVYVGSTHGWAI